MYHETKDHTIGVLVGLLGLLLAVMYFIDMATCTAKTEGMGSQSRYSALAGCQIEVNPDQWIPLESYYFKQE